jgi:hypothetical protein
VTLTDGTTVVGWGECVNDYCDPEAVVRRERRASLRAAAGLVVLAIVLGLFGGATFGWRRLIEQMAEDECTEVGGTWHPVRSWPIWWPTGRGMCDGRERG